MIEPRPLITDEVSPGATPLESPEWRVYRAPDIDFNFRGTAPQVLRAPIEFGYARPGFPERIAIDPGAIMQGLQSVAVAPDVAAGVLRFLPGAAGVGDALGNIGKAIEASPLAPLGVVGGAVAGAVEDTVSSVMTRGLQALSEIPKTFDTEDGLQLLGNIGSLPSRAALTAVGGDTGSKLARGQIDFSTAPDDIMDTLAVVGLIPAFKVAGMLGRGVVGAAASGATRQELAAIARGSATSTGAKSGVLGTTKDVLSGYTQPIGRSGLSSVAENIGRFAGRVTLGATGAGLGVEAVLPRMAPNEWWAKEIMDNRLVPDESAWRFPFELATSLPLDVFALTRTFAIAKQSDWAARLMGHPTDHLDAAWPRHESAVSNGLISEEARDWVWGKALRDAAARRRVEMFNAALPEGAQIKDFHQLPPDTYKLINQDIDQWLRDDPRGAYEAAKDEMLDWPGMKGLDEANQMALAEEFYSVGRPVEMANPDRVLGVADLMKNAQAPLAAKFLDDRSSWTAADHAIFKKDFPAFAKDLESYLADKQGFKAYLSEIAGNSPAPAKLGTLQSKLADLNVRLLDGEQVHAQRRAILEEIKSIREEVASGFAKQREALALEVSAREGELFSASTELERQAISEALDKARRALSKATEDYYNAYTAGSRWQLERTPAGNVMRLADDIPARPERRGGRTPLGKTYDTLFGAVHNSRLGREAHDLVRNAAAEAGVEPSQVDEWFEKMRDHITAEKSELPGGMLRSPYSSVWHLPPGVINKFADAAKMPRAPSKYKDWAEVMFRAYPGPLRVASKQVFGRAIDIPYNSVYHLLTRTYYPMFRFYLSPRFILMNLNEGRILSSALGARGTPEGEAWDRLLRLSREIKEEATRTEFIERAATKEQIAKVAFSKRPDEVVSAVLDVLHDHPAMEAVLREHGVTSKQQLVKFLDDVSAERRALWEGQEAATAKEKMLKEELDALKKSKPTGKGASANRRSAIEAKTKELADTVIERKMREEARKAGWKPELQPFLDAMIESEKKLVEAARRVFNGNPDRSAAERALNSFLLFWPLSYQIKAGKAMSEFMLSRAVGYRTGMGGAQTWLEFRAEHERKLQNDPEYAAHFQANRDLLFVLQQMVPITPEDIGVSLSPYTRIPFRMSRKEAPTKIWDSITNLGAIYDYKLGEEIVREQTRPGGLLYDLFSRPEAEEAQGPQWR